MYLLRTHHVCGAKFNCILVGFIDLNSCFVPLKSRGMCLSSAVLDREKVWRISHDYDRRLESQISLLDAGTTAKKYRKGKERKGEFQYS